MASVPNMRLGPTARPGVSEQPGESGEGEGFAQLLSTTLPAAAETGPRTEKSEDPDGERPAIGGDSATPIAQADAILSLVAMQAAPKPAPIPSSIPAASGAVAPELASAAPQPGVPNPSPSSATATTGIVTVPGATLGAGLPAATDLAPASDAASGSRPGPGPYAPAADALPSGGQPAADLPALRPGAGAAPATAAAIFGKATAGPAATANAAAAATPAQPGRMARAPAATAQPAAGQALAGIEAEIAAAGTAPAQAVQGPRRSAQPASSLAQPKSEVAAQAPTQPVSIAAALFASAGIPEPTVASQPGAAPALAAAPEASVERQLDLAADGEWLDQLARDIAGAGSAEGKMRFRLDPEHLGTLRVELAQGDRGTSVRLTVESEAARAIIADAQPKLVAEARAQGVKIAETHVDLAGGHAGDSRRQEAERREPQLRTGRESVSEAEPERLTRSRSDRYA